MLCECAGFIFELNNLTETSFMFYPIELDEIKKRLANNITKDNKRLLVFIDGGSIVGFMELMVVAAEEYLQLLGIFFKNNY